MTSAKIPSRAVKVERIQLGSKKKNGPIKLFLFDEKIKREIILSQSELGLGLKITADLTFEERILEIPKVKSLAILDNHEIFVTDIDDFTYKFFVNYRYATIEDKKTFARVGPDFFDLNYLSKHRANAY